MAGIIKIVPSTTHAVTSTKVVPGPRGGYRSATFIVNVTAIGTGDTWTAALNWKPVSANVNISNSGNMTAVGTYVCTNASPFTLTNRAIPIPDNIVFTNIVDGGNATLTYEVWAVLGD